MGLRLLTLCSMLLVTSGFSQSSGAGTPPIPDSPTKQKVPNISVISVAFENVTQLSTADQDEIASDLKSRSYHGPDWLGEFDDRVRDAWQQHGYFGAQAHSNAHQRNDDPSSQEVEVSTRVDEGPKYLLKEIQWVQTVVFSKDKLDGALPIHRLDTFDTGKVRQGFENLRKLYNTKGYVQMVVVPDTEVDDADQTVTLKLELQSGEVYQVGTVDFLGGTSAQRNTLRKKWPLHAGEPFDPDTISAFLVTNSSLFPSYVSSDQNIDKKFDEQSHTVNITVHLERR